MRNTVRLVIRGYQLLVSPVLGNHCRFYPTCSQYAIEAIDHHGVVRGACLAIRRLSHCHPWHPGGVDPVPLPLESKDRTNCANDRECSSAAPSPDSTHQ